MFFFVYVLLCKCYIYSEEVAWQFVKSFDDNSNKQLKSPENDKEQNCFTSIDYSPLPTLDVQFMVVSIIHVRFYLNCRVEKIFL